MLARKIYLEKNITEPRQRFEAEDIRSVSACHLFLFKFSFSEF